MMFAGKDAPAKKMVKLRVCVSAGNKNSFARYAAIVPQHGHAMSGILATQSDALRHKPRPDMLQTNQTDAGDGETLVQLRSEARGQLQLHNFRFNAEVGEDSPADYTLNNR